MELSTLKFAVDTSELKTAVDLVKTLGDATRELGQDVSKLANADKNAAAASLMNAKARKENAQAAAQEAKNTKAAVVETNKKVKAEKEVVEATSQRVQAENRVAEASAKTTRAAKAKVDMLEREKDVTAFMTEGYTRATSRQLALYKSTGALTSQVKELGNELDMQRKLIGGDVFDKSSSYTKQMRQEVQELTMGLRLLDEGLIGTSAQIRGFARDQIRLTEIARAQGHSEEQLTEALAKQRAEYVQLVGTHNGLIAQEKEQDRLSKERAKALVNQAKANDYVANEMNRAENALQGLNGQLQISSSNRILKFEQALNKSGLSVEQRTAELERYKAVIIATDAARAKSARRASMEQSERQVNLLARSLAPQISDVLVSLQTGMNPFTVMMQQGMQVRDLIQLSGVESEKLGEAFKRAGSGMITTSMAAGKAIGSMIVGVLMDAGKMVTSFTGRVTGLTNHIENLRYQMTLMSGSNDKFLSFLGQAGLSIGRLSTFAVGLAAVLPVALMISFAVALRQVIKEENELNRVTTSLGASMGLNYKSALDLTSAMGEVSGSTSRAITVLQEFIKSGNLSKDNYKAAADAIIQANIVMGTSIEDLVSKYSELAKSPTEGLIQLAKETGKVEHSLIAVIRELENSGNANAAAALAVKERARVEKEVTAEVEENLGVLSKMALYIKRDFIDMWNTISGEGRTTGLEGNIKKAEETLARMRDDAAKGFGISFISDYEIKKQQKVVDDLRAEKRKKDEEDAKKRNKTELELIRSQQSARDLASRSTYDKNSRVLIAERERLLALEIKGEDVTKELNANTAASIKLQEEYIKSLEKKEEKQKKGPSENFAERSLYAFSKAAIEAENKSEDLTRSQLKLLQIMEDPRWVGLSSTERAKIKAQAEEAIAYEKTAKAIKQAQEASKQAAKEAFDNEAKLFDEMVKTDEALKNSAKAIDEETQMLEYQASIIGLTSEERAKSIEFRKLEIELAEELRKIEENPYTKLDPSWAAEQRAKAHENFLKKRSNLDAKYDLEYNQKLTDGLTDAVMTGLIEGGKAGKKKLRDLIVAELQKPIQVFIQATISNIFGGGNGGLTGGSGGWLGAALDYITGGSGSGSGGGIMSAIGNYFTGGGNSGFGGMIKNAIGNYLGSGATGYGAAATSMTGQTAAMNAALAENSAALQAYGGGSSAGAGAGAAAGWAAFAYAMYKVADNSYKQGWTENAAGLTKDGESRGSQYSFQNTSFNHDLSVSDMGVLGKNTVSLAKLNYDIMEKIGAGSSKWNYIMTGMQSLAVLFGRKLKGYGYDVDIQGSNVDVGGYQYYKGGLFRSNKTTEFDVNPKDAENVRLQVESIRAGTRAMSLALGGGTEAIDNFTGSLRINFKGAETAAEQAERMADAWDQLQADMLTAGTGIEYTKEKIKAMREEAMALASAGGYNEQGITDALVGGMTGRMTEADVGAALGDIIVGSVYNALAMGFANQITGMITSMIIQPIMTTIIAGGSISAAVSQASISAVVSQAQAAINAFNQVIADPAFQGLIGQLNGMVGGLAKISVQPVKNIRSFGSAVHSAGNAAKEAADKIKRETYDLQTKLMQALGMTDKLRQRELAGINAVNRGLQKQIWALEDAKDHYDRVKDSANDALDKAKDVQDKLKQIFDFLLENIRELRNEADSTNKMQLKEADAALRVMVASGEVQDFDKLQEVVRTLRDGIESATYGSKVERDKANIKLSNLLEELKVNVGNDLTQVDKEIALLETAIQKAEEQINALLGIRENTYSTSEAIHALNEAVGNYSAQIAASLSMAASFSTGAAPQSSSSSGGGGKASGGGGGGSSSKVWTADGYWAKNPDLQAEFKNANLANSPDFNKDPNLSARDEYLKWHWETRGKNEKRKYAKGGYYPGGSALVGEHGPEFIDFTRPGRVYTAGETQAIMGNSNDARIDARLANLESAMTQMVVATNKMQKVLNNARGDDGTSLNVIITNSQPIKVTS